MRIAAFSTDLSTDERAELAAYRSAFEAIASVCAGAARGDLELRLPRLEGGDHIADVRDALNRLLDLTDAFVREAGASLHAASEKRFHREFLVRGMLGSFREGASRVNEARGAMRVAADQLRDAERQRLLLADEFETAVLSASEQVAAASTELGATAAALTESASAAVAEAEQAASTVSALDASSQQIARVVTIINKIAAQTRLLALNATIEAARAGEAGSGFAVVATEVKHLAEQTAQATAAITEEIRAVQSSSHAAGDVLRGIGHTIDGMHQQVLGIADAVAGTSTEAGSDFSGLAQLAELLRAEVVGFLVELRPAT